MSGTAVLYKLLHIKQQQKSEAQLDKQQATEMFEQTATKLYEKLRIKESAEAVLEQSLDGSLTITKLKEQSAYIRNINTMILTLQQQVQIARKKLDEKQAVLTDAHIEVKKIEKLIELREEEHKQIQHRAESQLMDEISIRQYANANVN